MKVCLPDPERREFLSQAQGSVHRNAGRALSERENRRGVDRWRRLRPALLDWAHARAAAATAAPTLSREDRTARPDAAREDAVPAGRSTG